MKKIGLPFGRRTKNIVIPAAIVFTALAGRIAFRSAFPLPYDEGYHVGLIKLYTHHLNPFLTNQPADADMYGPVAREGSYLFHYLLSFPLRFIELFTQNELTQVYVLRGINIACGLATLYLLYRLARRLGLSTLPAQIATFGLAITPVFYEVTAEVNYDNLFITLILLSALLGIGLAEKLRKATTSATQCALFVSFLLLSSLVKFTFLPIALALVAYLGYVIIGKVGIRSFLKSTVRNLRQTNKYSMAAAGLVLLVSTVAWSQRYGVNLVRYHDPKPDCAAVLSEGQCANYGAWARDNSLRETVVSRPMSKVKQLSFTAHWLKLMYDELYAHIYTGPGFVSYASAPFVKAGFTFTLAVGAVCLVMSRRIFAQESNLWVLLGLVSGLYLFSLWEQNFTTYRTLHQFIAIQGRYLLPVLPVIYLAVAFAYQMALGQAFVTGFTKLQTTLSGTVLVGLVAVHSIRRRVGVSLNTLFTSRPQQQYMQYEHSWRSRSLAT